MLNQLAGLDAVMDATPKHRQPALLAALASRVAILAARIDGQEVEPDPTVERRDLSVKEASKRLGLSLPYTYELCRTGKIPARQRGRRWVVFAPALDAHMAKRSRDAP